MKSLQPGRCRDSGSRRADRSQPSDRGAASPGPPLVAACRDLPPGCCLLQRVCGNQEAARFQTRCATREFPPGEGRLLASAGAAGSLRPGEPGVLPGCSCRLLLLPRQGWGEPAASRSLMRRLSVPGQEGDAWVWLGRPL